MSTVASFKDVSVHFPMYGVGARSFKKNLVAFATGGLIKMEDSRRIVVVEALRNITLDMEEGDRIGLVGHNGAGKSTLLRTLSGIYEPTMGEVEVNGRLSSLLDIGVGTEGNASGYENIRLTGLLQGMSVAQITEKTPEIAEFSGLGDYLKMPLRTYSSGMMLRLAFAVATCAQPEVLVMDEWIAAGDKEFTTRASKRLKDLVGGSRLLVLASHNTSLLKEVCNKAILMEHGRIVDFGNSDTIIGKYINA